MTNSFSLPCDGHHRSMFEEVSVAQICDGSIFLRWLSFKSVGLCGGGCSPDGGQAITARLWFPSILFYQFLSAKMDACCGGGSGWFPRLRELLDLSAFSPEEL